MRRLAAFFLVILTLSRHSVAATRNNDDPFLWLEDVSSPQALNWVSNQNAKTLPVLQNDPRYAPIAADIRSSLTAQARLATPELHAGWIYNFWQDEVHVKGIWRRTTPEQYQTPAPQWDVVLDLDLLAKTENEDWVWKEPLCLSPGYQLCLLNLSRGGKDAVVVREFNTESRSFVKDGFNLPEAKSDIAWMDKNTLLVATDFGPDSLMLDGYSRVMKLWKRGNPLASAKQVLQGDKTDVELTPASFTRPEGSFVILTRGLTFYTSLFYRVTSDGSMTQLPVPNDLDFRGVFDGNLLGVLRSDWTISGKTFPEGSLIAYPLTVTPSEPEIVYAPDHNSAFSELSPAKDYLYLTVLENVKGQVLRLTHTVTGGWVTQKLPLPDGGTLTVAASDDWDNRLFVEYESFLVPSSLYRVDAESNGDPNVQVISKLPDLFDASGMVLEQFKSASKDGTEIPYFIIHKKGIPSDGSNPTLLYGYGGFEVSETPYYLGAFGKVWLEKGGVFVLANIRGGGEFGPKWHEAAILQNRQKAYDDFASVAEDLITRGLTSPRRLGIRGGSNGGLLMGVELTQHPELFHAVLCEVPLLDMLRYTQLQAGFSWVGEYGDPSDPQMAAVISQYSPYQNVKAGVNYPKAFFLTSTADDRVGPGQARKMAAKMEAQGHDVLFYESTDGGHSAGATIEARVTFSALEDTYLFQQLVD